MGRTDQVSCLSRISCPVVVICGKQDLLTPLVCSETMSREIRNSRLIALDECGHMSSMEKPETVSGALREWLLASS
jgi:pimeloyl-ACP methyl ester carboxylesterase